MAWLNLAAASANLPAVKSFSASASITRPFCQSGADSSRRTRVSSRARRPESASPENSHFVSISCSHAMAWRRSGLAAASSVLANASAFASASSESCLSCSPRIRCRRRRRDCCRTLSVPTDWRAEMYSSWSRKASSSRAISASFNSKRSCRIFSKSASSWSERNRSASAASGETISSAWRVLRRSEV